MVVYIKLPFFTNYSKIFPLGQQYAGIGWSAVTSRLGSYNSESLIYNFKVTLYRSFITPYNILKDNLPSF